MLRMSPVYKGGGGGCRVNTLKGVRLSFSKPFSSHSSVFGACYLSGPCARARGGGGNGGNSSLGVLCAPRRPRTRIHGGEESRLSEPSAEEARLEGIKAVAAASAMFVTLSVAGHSVPQLDDAMRQSRADDDARDANLGISPLTGKREPPPPGRGGAYGMTRFLLDGDVRGLDRLEGATLVGGPLALAPGLAACTLLSLGLAKSKTAYKTWKFTGYGVLGFVVLLLLITVVSEICGGVNLR
mmetsp:Transcript_13772/g.34412  ORF Transcript_13772/g.34412 Transcript_13772/m.34412 type:complete len:241 (-) Transcript_13772:63-785(-)